MRILKPMKRVYAHCRYTLVSLLNECPFFSDHTDPLWVATKKTLTNMSIQNVKQWILFTKTIRQI